MCWGPEDHCYWQIPRIQYLPHMDWNKLVQKKNKMLNAVANLADSDKTPEYIPSSAFAWTNRLKKQGINSMQMGYLSWYHITTLKLQTCLWWLWWQPGRHQKTPSTLPSLLSFQQIVGLSRCELCHFELLSFMLSLSFHFFWQ